MHIPWDRVDDYGKLAKHASDLGIRIGAINPNVFQEDDYRLGVSAIQTHVSVVRRPIIFSNASRLPTSLTHSRSVSGSLTGRIIPARTIFAPVRTAYTTHLPRRTRRWVKELSMLLEYKLYEPSFYTMDVPDWGTSLLQCLSLGDKAKVLVDTGHHALATNIEFLVAVLLRTGRLGGFHFNSRFYGDDDLMVGAADPYQLFRIMFEIVDVEAVTPDGGVAFMLDQCHNIEPKIQAEIRSVLNVQEATAQGTAR